MLIRTFINFLFIFPLITWAATNLSLINDPFTYSGAYTDSESGQQYLNARYYNPRLMRFATRDSCTLMDRYGYGNANPIMNDDPTGHISMGWQAGVGMGIGGVSGVIAGFFTAGIFSFVAIAITEAVIGGASSAISDGVTYALGGKMTWKQAVFDAGLGGAVGLLGSAAGAGMGKVMGASGMAGTTAATNLPERIESYSQVGTLDEILGEHHSLDPFENIETLRTRMENANCTSRNACTANYLAGGNLYVPLNIQNHSLTTDIVNSLNDFDVDLRDEDHFNRSFNDGWEGDNAVFSLRFEALNEGEVGHRTTVMRYKGTLSFFESDSRKLETYADYFKNNFERFKDTTRFRTTAARIGPLNEGRLSQVYY